MFKKAERKKARLRLALCGPSGSGKTYSALLLAKGLGGRVAMIDTENGSGELYAHLLDYDVCQITPPFTPEKYVQAIHEAERLGYSVIIVDSLTHAWSGQGGILEEVDKRKSGGNQFTAWRDVTPMHNRFVDSMIQSSAHIIATMRTKTAYDMVKDEKTGKIKPVKIGQAPVQRDGMEYEFTVVMDLDVDKHVATASKDRTSIFDGTYFIPDEKTGHTLLEWLETGIDPAQAIHDKALQDIAACATVTALEQLFRRDGQSWQSTPRYKEIVDVAAARKKAIAEASPPPAAPAEASPETGRPAEETPPESEPPTTGEPDTQPAPGPAPDNGNGNGQGSFPPQSGDNRTGCSTKQQNAIYAIAAKAQGLSHAETLSFVSHLLGWDVQTLKGLSKTEASKTLDTLQNPEATATIIRAIRGDVTEQMDALPY